MKELNEIDVCEYVINMLSDKFDRNKFGIEHRSDSYVSLIYCDNDFFRVKYTNVARWISIDLIKEDRLENDPRFLAQKKKTQRHWKAAINSIDDIKLFKNELHNACRNYMRDFYIPR